VQFFEFSRKERWGIACLLSLIVLLHFLPSAWDIVFRPPPVADTSGLSRVAAEVAVLLASEREAAARKYRGKWSDSGKRGAYYRDGKRNFYRGGKSYYRDGKPYRKSFDRDTAFAKANFHKYKTRFRTPIPEVNINAADSAQWERLPGIGPSFARRIVRYRNRLGGFHSVQQVSEVYGLADSVFKKIQPFLRLGDVSLRKLSLNDTDEKSFALHPYINTNLARLIIRYRSAHGPFRQVETLRALALVDDSIYRKIEKYLTVN
jgi:competence ComEA-like helix-hairpin-helix protein